MRSAMAWLGAPVDASLLGLFRALFGSLLLVAVVRYAAKGWIGEHFVAPRVFLPAIDGLGPLPAPGMHVVFAVLALAALAIALGVATRAASAVACVLWTYQHLADRTNYLNHHYLIGVLLFLLALLPTDRALSLRAWRDPTLPRTVPRGALFALRAQVGLVYAFAGLAKLGPDWLLHAQPLRLWLGAHEGMPIAGGLLAWAPTAYAMSWAGAAFDLAIVPLLCHARTRRTAYLAALGFHLVTGLLFPLGMFPWVMSIAALVFFPADAPRRWLGGRGPSAATALARPGLPAAIVALHLLVQLLLPLRAVLHPGDVLWTERGFRWSWRVMVMEKAGSVTLDAREPRTGRTWTVSPRDRLTPYQARMAEAQPDLIVALARDVAAGFAARGRHVEVRARAVASLNGRPPAPILDPTVDLARDDLDLDRAILPAPQEPPP